MIVTIDFESFWDKDYSLTKTSEAEYILDPRFEAIMVAIKLGSGLTYTYVDDEIAAALAQIDWPNVALLAHNTRFDGSILAWRYGYTPRMYLDTLSMARAITHWEIRSSSLKKVSEHLKLPPKGDEVMQARGKHLADFTPQELQDYREYCARDNDNCYEIFQKLRSNFTAEELSVIDLVLHMHILPQAMLNTDVLREHLVEVEREKAAMLARVAHIDKSVFASNPQFAKLLTELGVEVPMKPSPTGEGEIPAIARNDWAFKELCADSMQPPVVQALLATRLSVKSTIEETRTRALLRLSQLHWPAGHSWAPVPLKYSAARTHRFGGDDGFNWQNFKRGSAIRNAIQAPEGWRIVHRDASQIEARMVAWMAWCTDLLDAFAEGRDVYSEFASTVYDKPVTRADAKERFVGKTAILGLGYGCGSKKFRHMLFIGNGGVSMRVEPEEAERIVDHYRSTYVEITDLWRAFNYLVRELRGDSAAAASLLKGLPVSVEDNAIVLPSKLKIKYPGVALMDTDDGQETQYNDTYGGKARLYGAKLTENISQALARIVITDVMVRVYHQTKHRPFLTTHDSLDYVVPACDAEAMDRLLTHEFSLVPSWAEASVNRSRLPLASEGGWGMTLLDAEQARNT